MSNLGNPQQQPTQPNPPNQLVAASDQIFLDGNAAVLASAGDAVEDYLRDFLRTVDAGFVCSAPFDFSQCRNKSGTIRAAMSCALNGPVGIAKQTNFSGIQGKVSIRDLTYPGLNGGSWRAFVCQIATTIEEKRVQTDPLGKMLQALFRTSFASSKNACWPLYDVTVAQTHPQAFNI